MSGNILLDLIRDRRLGANQKSRLEWVWGRIQHYYKELGIQSKLDHLTLSMFTEPDSTGTVFPRLKSKANEPRHLLPCLLEIMRGPLVESHDDYARCRFGAVVCLCRV